MRPRSNPTIEGVIRRDFDCSPKAYWRAATARFEAAKVLHGHLPFYPDAAYLAGYVAECSLKAMILKWTPEPKWADVCKEISTGAKVHDLLYLAWILKRKDCSVPTPVMDGIKIVNRGWATGLRYEATRIPIAESRSILDHVGIVFDWARRILG